MRKRAAIMLVALWGVLLAGCGGQEPRKRQSQLRRIVFNPHSGAASGNSAILT
jgi:hypothetical protein